MSDHTSKFQVVAMRAGDLRPVGEYAESGPAFGRADAHNRELINDDGPLSEAYLVMYDQELIRGPAAVMVG